MQEIEFRIEPEELGIGWYDVANVYVDGMRLQDMTRPVEQLFADRDGNPDLAGEYAGLAADDVRWPSRHFLTEPVQFRSGTGDTVLLGCVCGFADCGPLTARVDVTAATVMWRNFRSGHRDWDLSALGTLVFDRKQYERALRASRAA